MTAIFLLSITMVLAAVGVPASAILLAKLGLTEPFSIVATNRSWHFGPWAIFTKTDGFHSLTSSSIVNGNSSGLVSAGAVTVICIHLASATPLVSSGETFFITSTEITTIELQAAADA